MELNSPEAITNNVLGTKSLDLALRYDVGHFVMISTDKAVNQPMLWGASKEIRRNVGASSRPKEQKAFVVVRFGNVLAVEAALANLPAIAAGGPVTITIRRFVDIS